MLVSGRNDWLAPQQWMLQPGTRTDFTCLGYHLPSTSTRMHPRARVLIFNPRFSTASVLSKATCVRTASTTTISRHSSDSLASSSPSFPPKSYQTPSCGPTTELIHLLTRTVMRRRMLLHFPRQM